MTIFEVIFLWDLAEQGPTPKDIQCLKNWGRNFNEICENSDTVKKTVKRPWKASENPVKNLQNPVCAKNAKRMALRFCDQFFSWVLPLYVAAADLCQRHTEPLGEQPQYQQPQATGQTVRHAACRMKDFVCHSFQVLMSLLTRSQARPRATALARLRGNTRPRKSFLSRVYMWHAWCQVCDELKTCTTIQGCVCGWHKGRRGWHIWHWLNSMKRPQSWQCFRSNASLAKRTCFLIFNQWPGTVSKLAAFPMSAAGSEQSHQPAVHR